MKYFLSVLLSMIFIAPLTQKIYAQNTAGNIKAIHALFDEMNRHDTMAIASFFDDSARLESPNWEGAEKGKQGVITVYSRYFKGTPDYSFTITNIVAGNDAVVVEYTFGGTFSNPEPGTPNYMYNKKYVLKASTRYTFKHNKITAAVSYFDQVAFLRQVGFFDQH